MRRTPARRPAGDPAGLVPRCRRLPKRASTGSKRSNAATQPRPCRSRKYCVAVCGEIASAAHARNPTNPRQPHRGPPRLSGQMPCRGLKMLSGPRCPPLIDAPHPRGPAQLRRAGANSAAGSRIPLQPPWPGPRTPGRNLRQTRAQSTPTTVPHRSCPPPPGHGADPWFTLVEEGVLLVRLAQRPCACHGRQRQTAGILRGEQPRQTFDAIIAGAPARALPAARYSPWRPRARSNHALRGVGLR